MTVIAAEAAVIGGGAAGCAAALRLAAEGRRTLLLEKSTGPPRRFCGEFLSGEARLTLDALGALECVQALAPAIVRVNRIHSARRSFSMTLATAGMGLTRTALDDALITLAADSGVEILRGCDVRSIEPSGAGRRIRALGPAGETEIRAQAVIGAWGKRSPLDRRLERSFLLRPSPWVGVKARFEGAAVDDAVALYLFPGGHCGFVNVEGGRGTLALLARQDALRRHGGKPEDLIRFARSWNPALDARLAGGRILPHSLMTIAQIPLRRKEPVAGGLLLTGDAAGITAPFLGLGVANALRSGVSAAESVAACLSGRLSPQQAQARHVAWWRRTVGANQRWSFAVSALLSNSLTCDAALAAAARFPSLADWIYRASRGQDWQPSGDALDCASPRL